MKRYTLLFDLGGVIENHDFHGFSKFIEKNYGIDAKLFHKTLLENLRLNDEGALVDREMVNRINELGLNYNLRTFYADYFKFISLNKPILEYIKNELRNKFRVCIFSNCRKRHIIRSVKLYHYDKIFDRIFISQYCKMRKPEPRYYKFVLNKLKVNPEDCIFIDDKERNMPPARKMGINCIVYTGKLDLLKEQLGKYS